MLAHVLVLLCGCACALSSGPGVGLNATGPPHYMRAYYAYKELAQDLEESIVSMSGNIPPLSDSRRHHAVIFNVINTEALVQSSCRPEDYDDDYLENLEESAPEAISDPEKVVSAALELLNSVEENTINISRLLALCYGPEEACNERIDAVVKGNNENAEAKVLLLAGQAASDLNGQGSLYNNVADNLDSLNFVLNAKDVLKGPVTSLADLYKYIGYLNQTEGVKC